MKTKKIIIPVIVIILLAFTITAYSLYNHYFNYPRLEYVYNKSNITDNALNNPYCGFYQIYPYKISDTALTGNILPGNINEIPDRLALVQINLCLYKDMPLTGIALSNLDSILAAWATTDKQLILRFLYDWNGEAFLTEPSNIDIILKHMEQTASIYNKYAKCIYILQGLYTGSYGEMHSSKFQSKKDIIKLAKKLYNVSDKSIFLAVRTPSQFRTITKGTDGLVNGRLGLFNDGILSSASDSGTYAEDERESEITFQDNLCLTVPNGGEVIINNPLNNLDNAIKDLKRMHISYINSMYDSAVLDKWKSSLYTGDDIFNGGNGYEYIEKHLGFRYIINDSSLEFKPHSDKMAALSILIKNTGFAPCYYPLDYTITCINQETNQSYESKPEIKTQEDNTFVIKLNTRLDIYNMELGIYKIYLNTADSKTGEIIKYAIDTPLEEKGYFVGTLTKIAK